MKDLRTDTPPHAPYGAERDSCALYMSVRKQGRSTFGTLQRALTCLTNMGHRTGFVNGEGDGAGIQTDIPRRLWARKLSQAGLRSTLATHPGFWVGHLLIPADAEYQTFRDQIHAYFLQTGIELFLEVPGQVRREALGPTARRGAPAFWQLAGTADPEDIEARLFDVHASLESSLPIHIASLSSHSVVYKVFGSIEALSRYYPELKDRGYDTAMALSHARYSTNTISTFERTQPFPLLGHNGEINTISRFRQEARQVQVPLVEGGSDSQDVDRTLHTLCARYGYSLAEAIEIVFPPVPHELAEMPPQMRDAYSHLRNTYGPYAQGPAAIVARYGDAAVASLDALGLRPLWFVETEKEYVLSSERGAIPFESMVGDPRALSPGEKLALNVQRGSRVDVLTHDQIREQVVEEVSDRRGRDAYAPALWSKPAAMPSTEGSLPDVSGGAGSPALTLEQTTQTLLVSYPESSLPTVALVAPKLVPMPWQEEDAVALDTSRLTAVGWGREHLQEIQMIVRTGKDPIGSLGHDGPLAVLSQTRVNVADYFKESVAVVTNPSIDRGREGEAFSTDVLIGPRPALDDLSTDNELLVSLPSPLLPGGHPEADSERSAQEIARRLGTITIEELLTLFEGCLGWLELAVMPEENVQHALDRLAEQSNAFIEDGATCLILDDTSLITHGYGWLDPHLAVAFLDEALRATNRIPNLRRRAGIVVRSASIRTLHDITVLYSLGADAINPYAMTVTGIDAHTGMPMEEEEDIIQAQLNIFKTLNAGIEKVTSTMGCHELRGYGRVSSTIGLSADVAKVMNIANYLGSDHAGLNWGWLDDQAQIRGAELRGEDTNARLARVDRLYPKFWKVVEACAKGEVPYEEVREKYADLTDKLPIALRHLLTVRHISEDIDSEAVDISIGDHALPLVIGAMSFGSQGELSYRAYAHAAAALNIICVNGEGGELPEMMGVYKANRGQQVASGRFGVNAEFLNSAAVIEIKIGQGAKPGEGGMLPAYKVTPQVARARRTTPYVSLLSPSNNHDLYSIEDLAQLIEELKTVNPEAKISVKCPVVKDIGIIAVGVAKAGADIINLTGYEGATGAARRHALQYVGLPAEIGVIQSHRALTESGIRDKVELWCDGGMKTGEDVVKMVLLGANRVGFATMAMVAIGCTICRKCNEGTCHVGITTHIKTVDEATKKGLKSFEPRDYDHSVEGIVRVFDGIADEIRMLVAGLGASQLQDLVGRADLLEQSRWHEVVDLSAMLDVVPEPAPIPSERDGARLLTRPRNYLTRIISELVMEAVSAGERTIIYPDEVMAFDRALGAHLAGDLIRIDEKLRNSIDIQMRFGPSSVAGNGFAAWTTDQMDILIEGGAQDGVAKGASGGRVAIMKGLNHQGERIDGSVGKSFAYGAQNGILIVQGSADSRACIRLSGADVIIGGEITQPLDESRGIGTQANIKGFACEYMTSGRVVILGDPGPYAFAGMTGGVVYQLLTPSMGFDKETLKRRLARGANVEIGSIESSDFSQIRELLGHYMDALKQTMQHDMAHRIASLCDDVLMTERFVRIVPTAVA